MDDPGMVRVAQALSGVGFDVVRFNFPYREQDSARPDPMPVLKESIASVVARVRAERNPRRLIIGGRFWGLLLRPVLRGALYVALTRALDQATTTN